ncbi:MAG: twin-arginine translocation signal domain-containing protein [Vicinamibacteria bacterium]
MMGVEISRRQFLLAGAAAAGTTAFGFDLSAAAAVARELKIARTTETRSVYPYCAVGCGVVIHTLGDGAKNVKATVVHIEGDTESPINRGTLCSKGISLKQYVVNDRRLTRALYRAPGASDWTPIAWDEAVSRLARRIKETRDRGFEPTDSAPCGE